MQICYACHFSRGSTLNAETVGVVLGITRPAKLSVADTKDLNRVLVSGVPSSKANNGPGELPRIARYGTVVQPLLGKPLMLCD